MRCIVLAAVVLYMSIRGELCLAADDRTRSQHIEQAVSGMVDAVRTGDREALRQKKAEVIRAGVAAVPLLTETFKHSDPAVRREALRALAWIGESAAPAAPALVERLDDPDRGASRLAWRILAEIGKGAVPSLKRALRDQRRQVRLLAAAALRDIGPDAAPAISELVTSLEDDDQDLQETAAIALGNVGAAAREAMPKLLPLLDSENPDLRGAAAYALGCIGPSPDAISKLVRLLPDTNENVRCSAASALGKMGSVARPAMPKLVARLKSVESFFERREILVAVREIGPAERSVPLLVEHLGDDDYCSDLLLEIGEAAIPKLQGVSRSDDVNLRRCVAFTLGRMDFDTEVLISTLVSMADDEDEQVRAAAYRALGRRGAKARRVRPLLKDRLSEKSNDARISAATAYWRVGGDAGLAASVIISAVGSDESEQDEVAETIEEMGRPAVKALVSAMTQVDRDGFTRGRLAFVLGSIGNQAADAIPALVRQLADKHSHARAGAAYALGEIGPAAAPQVKQLEALLTDPDTFVRVQAAAALWRIDQTKRDQAMKLLLEMLQRDSSPANDSRHPATDRRVAAALAIGNLAGEAQGAVEALANALGDSNPFLRNAAADALGKISSKAAIPALEEAMWCDSIMVSQAAKEALARIREKDKRR